MVKYNRGLSTIVATLLIILLTLVAVGIIWFVVRGVIHENSEQIFLGKFTLDLGILSAQKINASVLEVEVKRNKGEGEFVGIIFVVEDGNISESIKYNVSMNEYESRKFLLFLNQINAFDVKKVSIAPIYKLESEKEIIGDIKDAYEVIGKSSQKKYIVVLNDISYKESAKDKIKTTADLQDKNFENTYKNIFPGFSIEASPEDLKVIKSTPGVKEVYEDVEFVGLLDTSTEIVKATEVWKLKDDNGYPLDGRGVEIGILDLGVDYTYPELGGCLGVGCKVAGGYDFIDNDPDPRGITSTNAHGTHVAGIAAANGALKGVAPGATIYAYRGNLASHFLAAVEKSIDPNGDGNTSDHHDIISLSIGSSSPTPGGAEFLFMNALDRATEAGVVVVIAAGNEGDPGDIAPPNSSVYFSMSCIATGDSVITVGATDDYDNMVNFSSRGPNSGGAIKPDIVAPGFNICSTGNKSGYTLCFDNNHLLISGTSMSTPHVSGAAALLLQKYPNLSPYEVKTILMQSADNLGYPPFEQGTGRLNVLNAINYDSIVSPRTLKFNKYGYQTVYSSELSIKNIGENERGFRIKKAEVATVIKNGNLQPTGQKRIGMALEIPSETQSETICIGAYKTKNLSFVLNLETAGENTQGNIIVEELESCDSEDVLKEIAIPFYIDTSNAGELKEQNISLQQGWNIISFNVNMEDKGLTSVFSSLGYEINEIVISEDNRKSNLTTSKILSVSKFWEGNLTGVEVGKAYQVRVNSNKILSVMGDPINVSKPIELKEGWNYVAYYPDEEIGLKTALASIKPYIIKVQDENGKTYEELQAPIGWINNIGNMKPGEGYKIRVSQDCTLNYASGPSSIISQDIPLYEGWNTLSFNVDIPDKSLNSVFSSISPHGQNIESDIGNATFNGTWLGFSSISNSEGYKIRVDSNVTLSVAGTLIPSSTPIPLHAGWNIIPYYPNEEIELETALASIQPYILKVQDEDGDSYEQLPPPIGWVNSIGNMKPGEGYKIRVSQDCILTYP